MIVRKKTETTIVAAVEQSIYWVRGQRVILDADLAKLYGISTRNLNKAVQRNSEKFPEDFMFQLDDEAYKNLRFHFGISNTGRGGQPLQAQGFYGTWSHYGSKHFAK